MIKSNEAVLSLPLPFFCLSNVSSPKIVFVKCNLCVVPLVMTNSPELTLFFDSVKSTLKINLEKVKEDLIEEIKRYYRKIVKMG